MNYKFSETNKQTKHFSQSWLTTKILYYTIMEAYTPPPPPENSEFSDLHAKNVISNWREFELDYKEHVT